MSEKEKEEKGKDLLFGMTEEEMEAAMLETGLCGDLLLNTRAAQSRPTLEITQKK